MYRLRIAAGLFVLSLIAPPAFARAAAVPPKGFELNARVAVAAFAALAEAELDGALVGARTLAATQDAQSGDWDRIKGPLAAYAKAVPAAAAVWFARPDGSYYTVAKNLTDQNLADRGYFRGLMAGRSIEGTLVVSHSTGKKSVVIAVPIVVNGKTIGAIGVSTAVERLAARLDRQLQLPSNVTFYALNANGRTALHREDALMFDYPSALGSPTLAAAVKTMLTKPEGVVRYRFRGTERIAAFRHGPRTGWVFVLARVTVLP